MDQVRLALRRHADGQYLLLRKEYRQALQAFHEAFTHWNGFPDIHLWMTIALAGLEEWDKALNELIKAAKFQPLLNELYHYYFGFVLEHKSRFKMAKRQYYKALQIQPNNALTHIGLAYVRMHLGEIECAIAHAQRAVELAPKQGKSWLALAETYLRSQKWDHSHRAMHRALVLPDSHNKAFRTFQLHN